ncbi:hypothetical protein BJX61DRAFT_545714 [Aspergillus egyptiacus]|nr:hypothetical protein BJX61DRAFT_545714 [Aspergillus egyptiacus]
MALMVIIYVCAVFLDKLRGYIRLRQSYLTSSQHRLRPSATTVLVTAIPEIWLSVEALASLYDVFPAGIRNIWTNRNFDDLKSNRQSHGCSSPVVRSLKLGSDLVYHCWAPSQSSGGPDLRIPLQLRLLAFLCLDWSHASFEICGCGW